MMNGIFFAFAVIVLLANLAGGYVENITNKKSNQKNQTIQMMKREEFDFCCDEAIRDVVSDMDCMQERFRRREDHKRVLEAAREAYHQTDKLNDEVERLQQEIDDLNEQLEAKQAEMDAMCREKDAEIAELRQQLLEVQNEHLESERQHLEAEVQAKPLEIHNHFGAGSNSQVFNDKVNGRFEKAAKLTKSEKLTKKDKKDKKNKRWKKIVRKML